jgi:large subunit ribosomal protein L19
LGGVSLLLAAASRAAASLAAGARRPICGAPSAVAASRRAFSTEAPTTSASSASGAVAAAPVPAAPAPPRPPPWAPTHALAKRNFLPRRMTHLLQTLEGEQVDAATVARPVPDFRAGDVLEVKAATLENRRRVATVRGVCIARRNRGPRTSFELLTHVPGGGAVHRTFPLHSPLVHGVRVVERRKARRAKLYYLKDRNPKEYRA